MAVSAEHVLYLAAGIFGAAPTRTLTYDLMTRKDTGALANELGVSQYAKDVFGVSNQAKAEKLAENLLGTAVTADTKTAAIGALKGMLDANGGNVGAAGLEGILFLSRTADANYTPAWTQLQNRVAVAQAYVDSANPATTFPLTSVTQDTATRDAVIANIKSIADTAPLTVNTDTLVANKFSAGLDYTPGGNDRVNTLQDEDTLVGTGVNPTLNATLGNANDNGATAIHPTLTGVETVNVAFSGSANALGGAVNVLDLQDSTGIKSVNITRVSQVNGDVAIDNLTAVTESLSLSNTSVNTNSVEFSFVASAVSGAQDSTKITLNNANTRHLLIEQNTTAGNAATGNVGVPTEGFETINMVSSGSANTVGRLWAEDLQTLNISGDKDLTIGATAATTNANTTVVEATRYNDGFAHVNGSLSAVNAAELTGNLDVTFGGELNAIKDNTSGVNMAVTVTGGKGNDIVRLNNDTVGTTDLIDGGEGNNTLVLVSNAVVNAAGTAAAPVATVKNVQSLEVRTGHDAGAAAVGLAAADVVKVNADAFDKLEKIFVRNEGQDLVAGAWVPATEGMTVELNNLTAAQGTAITVAHGTTGNNGVINNVINANLKSSTGTSDTVGVTIVDGVNNDLRFNFQLQTNVNDPATTAVERVENVTLTDSDTESNTVDLVNSAQNTGTITLKGGQTGKFINLDAEGARGTNLSGYGLVETGAEGSFAQNAAGTAIATADTAVNAVISTVDYRVLNNGAGADVRLIAENIVAGEHIGDVIVRLGDVTRSDGVSSQAITTGTGNDTLIFDAQGVKNAGYTSGDTVKAGAGFDTLVIDGNSTALKVDGSAGVGGRIEVQKSEWDNTTGVDTLRLAGNQGVANVAGIVAPNAGGYYVEIDNEFVKQTDAGNGLVIINNDGDLVVNSESSLVLNLRPLAQTSNVTFVGANGNAAAPGIISSNRLQTEDNSVNSAMKLDGGDTDTATANNTGNNNVLEVFNNADVSINDLSNTKNFGRIESTNDTAVAQNLKLVLNDTVMDQLVDSNHVAANTAGNVERLVVVANNNVNVAAAVANLNIDASAVTNKFGLDVLVGRGTTNTIVGTAGADKVVILGNYTAAEATADGHTAVNLFQGANAITGAALANNGTAYKGADGIAGTADDVLLAYTGTFNLGAAGQGDTIETFGGVDLTGATISAGTAIVAHSAVRLTAEQFNNLGSITFVGGGAHGLQIVNNTTSTPEVAPNLSKVTVSGAGTTVNYFTGTEVPAAMGTATLSDGAAAQPTNGGTTTGTNGGTSTGGTGGTTTGTASNTLTNITDTFDNASATVVATFGGNDYKASYTKDGNASLVTTAANLTGSDTLTFGTGTDTLTLSGQATTFTINKNTSFGGATVTGLDVLQLDNTTNSVTVTDVKTGKVGDTVRGMTIKGGSLTDEITVANAAATATAGQQLAVQTNAGNDTIKLLGDIAGVNVDAGEGNDTISVVLDKLTSDAATIAGGNGTDTLKLTAAAIADIGATELAKLSSIEVLDLSLATAAATKTLDLTSIIAGGVGVNKVILPTIGAQTFTLKTELSNALEIDAGTVSDAATKFVIQQAVSTAAINVTNGFKGIELDASATKGALSVNLGTDATDNTIAIKTGTGKTTITGGDNGAATADTVTVTVNATAGVKVDASAATSQLVIAGTAANQAFVGGNQVDILSSGDFNGIVLSGGAGADRIFGDADKTHKVVLNQTATADILSLFDKAADKVILDTGVFTSLAGVTLATTNVLVGAGKVAGSTATEFLVLNTTDGALYYDADGSGATAAVKIANIYSDGTSGTTDGTTALSVTATELVGIVELKTTAEIAALFA